MTRGAPSVISGGPGATNDGPVALESVHDKIVCLMRLLACIQVARDAIEVGMEESTHSGWSTDGQREVAGSQNGIRRTWIGNALSGPDGTVENGKCKKNALSVFPSAHETQGVAEVLKYVQPWGDGNTMFLESPMIRFFNSKSPTNDTPQDALPSFKLATDIVDPNGDPSREVTASEGRAIRRVHGSSGDAASSLGNRDARAVGRWRGGNAKG
jgi:hypothetical protein